MHQMKRVRTQNMSRFSSRTDRDRPHVHVQFFFGRDDHMLVPVELPNVRPHSGVEEKTHEVLGGELIVN